MLTNFQPFSLSEPGEHL